MVSVLKFWRTKLAEVLPLNKNSITWVNCPDKHYNMNTTEETFYVYAGFASPGKHRYVVLTQENG